MIQLLNGLQLAMLLFLLSVGLSIVLGLMNFINLAHGTLYMLGAYFGLTIVSATGSFWLALLLAPLGTAIVGMVLYQFLLRRLSGGSPLRQILLTFGVIYVGVEIIRIIWGNDSYSIDPPAILSDQLTVLGTPYPAYRLFIIALGLVTMGVLFLLLERTRIGAIVRASVDDRESAECLGIDTQRLFLAVFALGCMLAGLGGVVAAPVLSVYPGMDIGVLIYILIIVVVGGPGSLPGAALGSLLVGMADTLGRVFIPQFSAFLIYVVMAAFLLLRPQGFVAIR
ncbi:MAG: branched-chain amino acid ABC transporter permease [Xanthobacteraceae bacterium]